MKKILSISKTCYSKLTLIEFLKDKENLNTLEDYKLIFEKMAVVLFEIDSSETIEELNDKFQKGILFPVGTVEHERILSDNVALYVERLLLLQNDFDSIAPIYTNEDVYNNLDKFKFL